MKNKFFILSTIISSCILTIACNQSTADELHPNMPSGGRQRCYPGSKCTGDPNLIGRSGGNQMPPSNGTPSPKLLQTESTEKFTGTVRSVDRVALPNQNMIQLKLSTDQGEMLVIVGPAQFWDQSKLQVKAGDKIVVTGYRIKANGEDVIMAAQIQKNGNTLQILDANRRPVWAGGSPGMQGSGMQSQQPGMSYQNGYQQQQRMGY